MKKLIIAAAIVCAAAFANAAYVSWNSGVIMLPDGKTQASTANKVYGYLFELASAPTMTEAEIWAEFQKENHGTLGTETKSGNTKAAGTVNLTGTTDYGTTDTGYAILVYTYDDATTGVGIDNYKINIAQSAEVGSSGTKVEDLALFKGGTVKDIQQGGALKWGPESVPEPTSGLLLLLGVAGLALKRKRA